MFPQIPIFSQKELKVAVQQQTKEIPDKEKKIDIIKNWQHNFRNPNFLNAKEEEIKPLFLTQIFGEVLNYKFDSEIRNLKLEVKTTFDSTKADAALGYFSTEKNETRVVVEIKDAQTNLDQKFNHQSAVEQGFAYAYKNGENCKWVIISNFTEIRLYRANDISKYEKFDLFSLAEHNEFEKFYFLLAFNNLFLPFSISCVEKFFIERCQRQENITTEFYNQYRDIRYDFFEHLKRKNKNHKPLILLQFTQTIIDRIVFICVVKAFDFLPFNVLQKIENIAAEIYVDDEYELWRQLKNLFKAMDKGLPPRIYKFNGGLFRQNNDIENLIIENDFLKKLLTLANYDFESDLNINILGRIFEQSISDIEQLKIEIENNENQHSQRKKDGIFYTPEQITRYIVENSVGKYLYEFKRNIGFHKNADKEIFEKYQNFLKNIKILDPACGSGAFLTQTFDFLLQEWNNLDIFDNAKTKNAENMLDFADETEKPYSISKIKKNIVNNNLFGVDLNMESVEITKLGLWLKSASKNDELALLDDNIKCGNSLISDKNISDKAFSWEKEFPQILNNQGFDVIIGNPPYVSSKLIENKEYLKIYKTAVSQFDLFSLFIEKSLSLLRENGFHSFIVPDSILGRSSFTEIRKMLLNENNLISIFQLDEVFADASVSNCIYVLSKNNCNKNPNLIFTKAKNFAEYESKQEKTIFLEKSKIQRNGHKILFVKNDEYDLIFKINRHLPLSEIVFAFRGEEIGKKSNKIGKKKETDFCRLLVGENIARYFFKNVSFYIDKNKISKHFDNYCSEKIVIRQLGNQINANFDNKNLISTQSVYNLKITNANFDAKYVLAILNSKVMQFIYKTLYAEKQIFPRILLENIKELSIPQISLEQQQPFIDFANQILDKNREFYKLINKFLTFTQSQFSITKFSERLKKWFLLEFKEFSAELNKLKVKFNAKKLYDFIEIFENEKTKALELQDEITKIDREIDKLIFQLYEISDSEKEMILKI